MVYSLIGGIIMPSTAQTMITLLETALASTPVGVEFIAMPDGEQIRYRKRTELLSELNYWYRQLANENKTVRTRVTNITRGAP
jgi:hypothetical protein